MPAAVKHLAVVDDGVGGGADQGRAEGGREVQGRVGEFGGVAGADDEAGVGPAAFQGGVAGDVVGVAVGDEDSRRGEMVFFQLVADFFRFQPRIDHQALGAVLAVGEVGIFAKTGGNDASYPDCGRRHKLVSPGSC